MAKRRLLYRTERAHWTDPWGYRHPADQIVERVAVIEAGTFPMNDGYSTEPTAVAVDECGGTYVRHVPIDYAGRIWWHEPVDDTFWWERLTGRVLDEKGEPWKA